VGSGAVTRGDLFQGFQGTLQGLTGTQEKLQGVESLFKNPHSKKIFGTQAETEVELLTTGPYMRVGGYMRRKDEMKEVRQRN
jgi:hypothetical protein